MLKPTSRNKKILKSALAGAVGGLAAAFAMNQFQALWSKAAKKLSDPKKVSAGGGEDATVKTAKAISEEVFDHVLTDSEKKWAGPVVHYAFGTLIGAAYGLLAETLPISRAGHGIAYGKYGLARRG